MVGIIGKGVSQAPAPSSYPYQGWWGTSGSHEMLEANGSNCRNKGWGVALGKRGALDHPHFAFYPRLYCVLSKGWGWWHSLVCYLNTLSQQCSQNTHRWGDENWGASGEEKGGLLRTHGFLEPSPPQLLCPPPNPLPVAWPLLVLITNQAGLT